MEWSVDKEIDEEDILLLIDPQTDRQRKWDRRYMQMARLVSTWSKDPSSKIGSVAVGKFGQILSTGYNGFPRSIEDLPERLEDRDTKLSLVVHAELNTVFNAGLVGVSLLGSTVYVYGLPTCSDCAKGLIQAGVVRVVVDAGRIKVSDRWAESWSRSLKMFEEARVRITELEGWE